MAAGAGSRRLWALPRWSLQDTIHGEGHQQVGRARGRQDTRLLLPPAVSCTPTLRPRDTQAGSGRETLELGESDCRGMGSGKGSPDS